MPSLQRSRVLLLIPHLGGGGCERVIETLARSLNPAKYDVHLALVTRSRNAPRNFPAAVSVHALESARVRRSAFRLLRLIRRIRPDLILSGIAHLNVLILALRPFLPRNTRIIARQNGALEATLASHPRLLARRAYSFAYRRADRILCQTDSMARELHMGLAIDPSRLLVLPNPTDLQRIRSGALHTPDRAASVPTLLAIGRLVPEKGFDILFHALAALPRPFRSVQLIIAGSGPELSRLQSQATAVGIADRVFFAGHVPDPVIRFRNASAFVLSSRTEGLPNAMLEAAAAGMPIVATPASSGIVDLLRNRQGVWLAASTSPVDLREALEAALNSIQNGARYPHQWVEPYGLSSAIPAYEAAIDQVIAE